MTHTRARARPPAKSVNGAVSAQASRAQCASLYRVLARSSPPLESRGNPLGWGEGGPGDKEPIGQTAPRRKLTRSITA